MPGAYSILILVSVALTGILYGILIQRFQVFPFSFIQNIYQKLNNTVNKKVYGPWSIGVLEGSTPFKLSEVEGVKNPIITAEDITDIDARFVADPFLHFLDGKYYIFFEALNRETDLGEIGLAVSSDCKNWEYQKIVLKESFHLSYPYVFEWEGERYLVPESNQDRSIRLYKASRFPDKWEYVGNLLNGYPFTDPSVFNYMDRWWLFVTIPESDILNLYYSDDLLGEWKYHAANPIIKSNKHFARPGGRVIIYNDQPFRFTQDVDPYYGIQVYGFEITELSETSYSEKLVSKDPIITKSGKGWNARGMHHLDVQKIGDRWISIVDGQASRKQDIR